MDLVHRWVKVQAVDEQSVVSAMVIDTIMKAFMLKLDQAFSVREQHETEYRDEETRLRKQTIDDCDHKVSKITTKFKIQSEWLYKQKKGMRRDYFLLKSSNYCCAEGTL